MAMMMLDVDDLTPRQREVCTLLARGKGNAEIAGELGVTLGTVNNHLKAISAANGGMSRLAIAVCFARHMMAEELVESLDRGSPNRYLYHPVVMPSGDPYTPDYREHIRGVARRPL
jgi:DNA-binding CsgD family transcriptional regulator